MTLLNPFSGLQSTQQPVFPRFPQTQPVSATTLPFVGTTQQVTFSSDQITGTISALQTIQSYYSTNYNPFGITTNQYAQLVAVLVYFQSLSAGTYTISIPMLQSIVTVSQMIRSLQNTYLNLMTTNNIITAEAILQSVSITNKGYGYVNGVYKNVPLISTTGNGIQAYGTITVSNLGILNNVSITTPGNVGKTYDGFLTAPLSFTGGTGTGATATLYFGPHGPLTGVQITAAGSGYTNGVYLNVPINSAAYGTGGLATVTVSGGAVTSIIITTPGTGYSYILGVTINATDIGGTGSGFTGNAIVSMNTVSGQVTSANITAAGSGYTSGTYTKVPLTGGTGSGAYATIIASGGITSVTITQNGGGYLLTDILSVLPSSVGGTGSGFTCTPQILQVGPYGSIQSLSIISGGSGYINGTFINIPITGGSGTGATLNATISGNIVTSIQINQSGTNYQNTDSLSCILNTVGSTFTQFTFSYVLNVGCCGITLISPGTGYSSGDILSANLASIGMTGTAPTFTVTTTSGVTNVSITQGGFGYATTDTLTVSNTSISSPGGLNFTCVPSGFANYSIQQVISPFPNGATTITCNDGYFIVENQGTGQWWVSNNQDGTSWSALQYALIESRADKMVAVDSLTSGQVVLFGGTSIEIWNDQGLYPFPFGRINGLQQDLGLSAKWSRANYGGQIIFLGQYYGGNAQVMMTQGNTAQVISTPDIDEIINSFSIVSDAIGYTYVSNGHMFYEITFPTGNRTFLYDFSTTFWSEVQSGITSIPNRHITNFGITFNNNNYASDCADGNIYLIDETNYTDNGSLIQREVDSMHIYEDGNKFSISMVHLDSAIGVGTNPSSAIGDSSTPIITLEVSKDFGNTFGIPRQASMNAIGNYGGPTINWRRVCGHTRDAVLRFKSTSAVQFIINSVSAVIRGAK